MKIENPTPSSIKTIIHHLNNEFIYSKNKNIGLEFRFKELFSKKNFHNLYLIMEGNDVASFVAVNPLLIDINSQFINAFAVGCVYTQQQFRGKRISSFLLKKVIDKYLNEGYEIGLLWTTIPEYYQKIGWVLYDNGLFVSCSKLKKSIHVHRKFRIVEDFDYGRLDSFRITKLKNRVIRSNNVINSYKVNPSPSENRLFLIQEDNNEQLSGYIIFGLKNKNVYIYEIISENLVKRNNLILSIVSLYYDYNIYFNIHRYDKIIKKLHDIFETVEVKEQHLQMYYCSQPSIISKINGMYIPFIDRI